MYSIKVASTRSFTLLRRPYPVCSILKVRSFFVNPMPAGVSKTLKCVIIGDGAVGKVKYAQKSSLD